MGISTVVGAGDAQVAAHARALRGEVSVPGDKSISHRALMFNALARGAARVDGFLDSADTRSTIHCLRLMGATIEELEDGGVLIHGAGRAALHEPDDVLDCGNSGTSMRLLAGILAGLPFLSILTGDASLRQRPMDRIAGPLREMGARIHARQERFAPLVIEGGTVHGGLTMRTPMASAQVKSAILLAGLGADAPTTVVEPAQSRDHTERMLAAMGAGIEVDGRQVVLTPPSGDLQAVDVRVPGDISTAAAWMVAGVAHPDAELRLLGVGMNPSRTGLIDILRAMGADLEVEEERVVGGEPVADVVVRSSRLRGVEVGGALVPRAIDELPLVALAACLAEGETVIRDAEELVVKESNRVATTAEALRALGATVEERPDGMVVQGGARLTGATVRSSGDHRLAMLGAVAGLIATGETTVEGAGDVAVSYPAFWSDLGRLRQS
ncbi:MAG: 3-phosphoshikimate 1-carboxyvinyltransferase [Dehalococcoidia bacterium]|nr:3-phosphoshikimate 1-carboxyvinyltransferase [Dehalococcoidia bacterium]